MSTHADNRPVPKPQFVALSIQPPPARLAPAIVQTISTAGSGSGANRRTSLVPVSRSHRMSSFGGNVHQAFGVNGPRRTLGVNEKILEEDNRSGNLGFAMSEKEIDERVCLFFVTLTSRCHRPTIDALKFGAQISKAVEAAVEAEVARRLAERERETAERVKAEEMRPSELAQVTDSRMTQSRSKSPEKAHSIPSGVLTPLLKRHKELDDELKSRLQELEQK